MTERYPEEEIKHSLAQEPSGVAAEEDNPPASFWGGADEARPPHPESAGDANADPAGPR